MKIAIDVSQVVYSTGVSSYTKNLLENLLEIDKQNEYLLFGGSLRRLGDLKKFYSKLSGNLTYQLLPIPPTLSDILGNKLHYPKIELLIGKMDVYHSSDWVQYPSGAFCVTTVHDLAPILYPELTSKKIVSVHSRRLTWVKKEVDRIIVPTKSIKADLEKNGFGGGKIRVIYEGVDPIYKPTSQAATNDIKKKYQITGDYLLSVGVNKRKNTGSIIKAFKSLKKKSLKLVIVGHKYSDAIEGEGVIYTGHVPDYGMPSLYSGASALVFPSFYEGFGLPILEAFACHCPVVTSNVSGMNEVAGNAAILVNPKSVDAITKGILAALDNKESLVEKGLKRVKGFSWERAAKETLEVYKESL